MKRSDIYPIGTPWWRHRLEKDEEEHMSDELLLKNLKTPLHDAIQHVKRNTPPRLFWLEYNHSRVQTKNAWTEERKKDKLSCWGTLYPDGGVSLQVGSYFESLDALKKYLDTTGEYSLTWLEERHMEKSST